jgi:tetratricopeptide (TPR) repeat protein
LDDSIPDKCKILLDSMERIGNKVPPQLILPIAIEAFEVCKELYGEESWEYWNALTNLGGVKTYLGQFKEALNYFLEADSIHRWDKNNFDYARLANVLGATYVQIGNFQRGIEVMEENHARLLNMNADTSITFMNNCTMLGGCYSIVGNYEKAFSLYSRSEHFFKAKNDTLNFFFAILLSNKGLSYIFYGDAKIAEFYLKRSLLILEQIGLKNHPVFLQTKASLAGNYGVLLANKRGIELLKNDVENLRNKQNFTLADLITLSTYSNFLLQSGQFEEADTLNLLVLSHAEKLMGEKSQPYLVALGNLGASYLHQNRIEEAVELCTEAMDSLMVKNVHILSNYTVLLVAYKKLGKKEESKHLITDVISLLESEQGLNLYSPDFQRFLSHSFGALTKPTDTSLLRRCSELFFPSFTHFIQQNFPVLTEKEKLQFLESQGVQTGAMAGMFFSPLRNDPQTARYFYDNALSHKGILLEDVIRSCDAIVDKGAPELKQLYSEWKGNRQVLVKQSLDSIYLDSLRWKTDAMEIELMRLSTPLRKALTAVGWQDVRDRLDEDEAAVEFIHFRFTKDGFKFSDSIIYCALVLRKEYSAPKLVYLFNGPELWKKLHIKGGSNELNKFEIAYASGYQMYNLVWKPLEPFLEGAGRVYFSPSGMLHQVAFDGILCPDNVLLSDRFDLRRVGSTRDLLSSEERDADLSGQFRPGSVLIVGDIPYDASYDSLYACRKADTPLDFDPNLGKGGGGKLAELAGSRRITRHLDSLFQARHWQTNTLAGCDASEVNLKQVLKQSPSPRIIHIDTHGMVEVQPPDTFILLRYQEFPQNPLNFAGLAFAGYNNKFDISHSKTSTGDGEIFATEFREFDLSGTELVTLSACVSSIGPTPGEEGMFGLQRAFRLAGARHVLATLYEVGDEATAVFMEYLYQSLLDGENVSDALRSAQNRMKKHREFRHPYYWAGFVLL